MTTLDPKDNYITLINTFSVDPDKADALLANLAKATAQGMSKLPGFISANLHISTDKRHVANYAQWRSQADIDAMMKHPDAKAHMQEAAALAQAFEPIYYTLSKVYSAPKS